MSAGNRGQAVQDAMKVLAAATAAAIEEINAGRAAIAAAEKDLEALVQLPIPLEEAEARVPGAVKAAGAAWIAEHGRRLLSVPMPDHITRGSADWRPSTHALGEATDAGSVSLPFEEFQDAARNVPMSGVLSFGALAAGDPAAAERILVGLLRAKYGNISSTVPLSARSSRIAELERTIERLKHEDEERTDAAIAAGLTVTHRPDVAQRRETEALQRRRNELLEEARAKQLETLDRQHAAAAAK